MFLRVAAVQLRTCPDRIATLSRARSLIETAVSTHDAQLIVLPEAWTGLYGVQHFRKNAEQYLGKDSGSELMSRLAKEHSVYVCGGVIEMEDANNPSGRLYNTIAAFGPEGEEVARYRKIHLSCVSVGDDQTSEGTVLTPGSDLSWFDIHNGNRSWRIGLLNCFDLRFKELSSLLTDAPPNGAGCDVLLYPAAWLKSSGDLGHWETLLKARALDGQCFTVGACNARDEGVSAMDSPVSFGRSCIIDPMGQIRSVCQDDTANEVVSFQLDMNHLIDTRRRIPLQLARQADVYKNHLLHEGFVR